MAISLKLHSNLLISSSRNQRSSLSGLQTLQFQPDSARKRFSSFKVEACRSNSTSNSRINNNAVLPLRPDDYTEVGSPPFEGVIHLLKSKASSVLIGSCLVLGLMVISHQRPALARTLLESPSASTESRSNKNNSGSEMDTFIYLGRLIICAQVVLPLVFFFIVQCIFSTTSYFIQVGLVFDEYLQRDLISVSEDFYSTSRYGLKYVLEDCVDMLVSHRDKWRLVHTESKVENHHVGYRYLEAYEERKIKKAINTETFQHQNGASKEKFAVVILLIELNGWHRKLKVNKTEDLDKFFGKLKSYPMNKLVRFRLLWSPKKGHPAFTSEDVNHLYPKLKCFSDVPLHSKA